MDRDRTHMNTLQICGVGNQKECLLKEYENYGYLSLHSFLISHTLTSHILVFTINLRLIWTDELKISHDLEDPLILLMNKNKRRH